MVFDPSISLSKAHSVADDIESEIKSKFNSHKWVFDMHCSFSAYYRQYFARFDLFG
ncbi:cation transporter dimerization domain-containing protein [Campylobacter fetus]|uniref:cation transporter dimerization domain-containing protein n=1 Tax=Campylobacter fetus TaxID=196 RepID=UPI001F07A79B|nr:cation transporter dimerization domain-containing protein [Campylobacter fetus]